MTLLILWSLKSVGSKASGLRSLFSCLIMLSKIALKNNLQLSQDICQHHNGRFGLGDQDLVFFITLKSLAKISLQSMGAFGPWKLWAGSVPVYYIITLEPWSLWPFWTRNQNKALSWLPRGSFPRDPPQFHTNIMPSAPVVNSLVSFWYPPGCQSHTLQKLLLEGRRPICSAMEDAAECCQVVPLKDVALTLVLNRGRLFWQGERQGPCRWILAVKIFICIYPPHMYVCGVIMTFQIIAYIDTFNHLEA